MKYQPPIGDIVRSYPRLEDQQALQFRADTVFEFLCREKNTNRLADRKPALRGYH